MRKIFCLAAAATLGWGPVAMADDSAAAIGDFGLLGTWASYCSAGYSPRQPGFRIVFGERPGAAPTYATISTDDRTVSDLTLVRELERCVRRLGLSATELLACQWQAYQAAFLHHDEQRRAEVAQDRHRPLR